MHVLYFERQPLAFLLFQKLDRARCRACGRLRSFERFLCLHLGRGARSSSGSFVLLPGCFGSPLRGGIRFCSLLFKGSEGAYFTGSSRCGE